MKKTLARTIALTAALTLGMVNMGLAAGGSIGHGDISVYKEGQLATKLTGKNPIEDGSMLVCDGKCMVKSEGISIIAEDASQIAVTNEPDTFKLYVKEGKVDYIINNNARKMAFYTPQGTYTVAEAVFNASGSSAVKGSVIVGDDGATEIVVTEGKMVFATADGMKTVDANNKLVLAVAGAGAGATGFSIGGMGTAASVAVVAGGVVAGAVVIDQVVNDDDDDPVQETGSSDSSSSGGTSSGSGSSSSSGSGSSASPSS